MKQVMLAFQRLQMLLLTSRILQVSHDNICKIKITMCTLTRIYCFYYMLVLFLNDFESKLLYINVKTYSISL